MPKSLWNYPGELLAKKKKKIDIKGNAKAQSERIAFRRKGDFEKWVLCFTENQRWVALNWTKEHQPNCARL